MVKKETQVTTRSKIRYDDVMMNRGQPLNAPEMNAMQRERYLKRISQDHQYINNRGLKAGSRIMVPLLTLKQGRTFVMEAKKTIRKLEDIIRNRDLSEFDKLTFMQIECTKLGQDLKREAGADPKTGRFHNIT